MKKFSSSRWVKKQEIKNIRRTIFFAILSLILIFFLFYFGPSILIKLSIFLGNFRSSSFPPEVEDKVPPAAPELLPFPEATSSAYINLHGFAEAGAKIEIFINGVSQKNTVADNNGGFIVNNIEITEGKNEIYALATDDAGNTSQPSEKIIVTLDKTPPSLNILQPEDKATFYGSSRAVEIKGEAEEEAIVTVNDHLATMEAGGKFRYSSTLSPGVNNFKIVATDKAGNQTEKELTLFLE